MEILRDPTPSSDLPRGGVVTIGNFDGVHRGHQVLLRGAVARARELAVPAVGLTFHPHPLKVLHPEVGLKLLSTRVQRAQLLARCGIDSLIELGFDTRFAATSARDFADEFVFRRLQPHEIRLGSNFRFGSGRSGDVAFLGERARAHDAVVIGIDPIVDGDGPISSSRIRRGVAEGDVTNAWQLLARPYFVDGDVYTGERMGRKLGFPTINVEVENELLPMHGVYVTAVYIPSFSRVFPSVTNIGVRPTVYENYHVTVESHVIDFTANVYREPVRLFFLKRLREERVFASSMELVTQIKRDVESSKLYFAAHGVPESELVLR